MFVPNRREFVGVSSALVAGAAARNVAAAKDDVEPVAIGLIGCGGRGTGVAERFLSNPGVVLAYACDPQQSRREEAAKKLGAKEAVGDLRRVLDDKRVKAVIVATPDHWHALPSVAALESGIDLYVEKPLALSIKEGRRMVDAARNNNRVVQCGTFQRSGQMFNQVAQMVREGKIGKVSFCRTWYHENNFPKGIGNPPNGEPPEDLDWNFWLGPAPYVPYNKNRCLYNFRWFWDYSGGRMTDWGTHLMDIVHLGMGVNKPLSVSARGGKFVLQDNRETPDTLVAVYEYPGFVAEFEARNANTHYIDNMDYGIAFHGTDATLVINREKAYVVSEKSHKPEMEIPGDKPSVPHVENFLNCIVSRERPVSDVEICHQATIPAHLGNIALKLRRTLNWDGDKEQFINDPEADAQLMRPYREPWVL